MTAQDRSWLLIARAISGDITLHEQKELDLLLLADPELHAIFNDLKGMQISQPPQLSSEAKKAMERGLDKLDQSLSSEKRFLERYIFDHSRLQPIRNNNYKAWASVAAIAAMLVCSFYIFRPSDETKKSLTQHEIATHYGKRIHTILPDGSTVWLNSGSSITYAKSLISNGKREVNLSGEAYFDIKHDSKHPFIVHAGKLRIVVLGTSFNVKAYKEDSFIETTLIRGKVSVINDARPGHAILLLPDEKLTINKAKTIVKKITLSAKRHLQDSLTVSLPGSMPMQMPDDAITETAWVNNKLTFKKEKFGELATQLERWYDVKITFDNDRYLTKQFTGTFSDQDINEVMRALQFTQSFHYTVNNNQIHIW